MVIIHRWLLVLVFIHRWSLYTGSQNIQVVTIHRGVTIHRRSIYMQVTRLHGQSIYTGGHNTQAFNISRWSQYTGSKYIQMVTIYTGSNYTQVVTIYR